MNTNVMPVQKQTVAAEIADPQQVARRNRDAIRISVALAALVLIATLTLFCAFQFSPPPVNLP
jgi:hypothetical protein